MGLFSRKDSAAPRKPPGKVRPSVSSEAQAADLRVRARRRLAGAVALVLAAVVVLPMLFDSEPAPVSNKIPIKIPDRNAPFQPNLSDPVAANTPATPAPPAASSPVTSSTVTPPTAPAPTTTPPPKPEAKPRVEPPPAAAKVEPAKPIPNPPAAVRSDDGARAVALLEGRPTAESSGPPGSSATPKAPTRGNFVVQAMSLDAAADAQTQKNKLLAAGVGNAFVDGPVDVNGKSRYRVRVGPFPSREAAQAAQTRLRTLGFDGAFIATQ